MEVDIQCEPHALCYVLRLQIAWLEINRQRCFCLSGNINHRKTLLFNINFYH